MIFKADLHTHSCLSPCGDLEMSPRSMAERACQLGIHMLALTDHNTAANCPAFDYWCRQLGLVPVFGIEVTTVEELHALVLYESLDEVQSMDDYLRPLYRSVPNQPEKWGDQVIVDYQDMIVGQIELHLTSGSSELGLTELAALAVRTGGICIPAHIDRANSSIMSQLGALPPGEFAALEVSRMPAPCETHGLTLICSSDAHYLDDLGRRTISLEGDAVDFFALRRALEAGFVNCHI